jgi:hypothetical protein
VRNRSDRIIPKQAIAIAEIRKVQGTAVISGAGFSMPKKKNALL